jgi:L-fuconolactonase
MKLDAHQHFWNYNDQDYPWIPTKSALQRDWLPNDWRQDTTALGMDGSIAVQARQTIEETRWLLSLADQYPFIKGVVGWVDLCSDRLDDQLAELSQHPKLVGVRHVVQDEPDDRFMLLPEFLRGIAKLKLFDLTYDVLIYPRQLPAAIEMVNRFPEQPFVLDHLGKPLIRDGTISPWREQIRELAQAPNSACKVSGMVTEANRTGWRNDDFRPYLDAIFEAFGPDRLMFGSDWPVCLLAGSYRQVFDLVNDYTRQFSAEARDKCFGANAVRFYGIGSA